MLSGGDAKPWAIFELIKRAQGLQPTDTCRLVVTFWSFARYGFYIDEDFQLACQQWFLSLGP